MRGTQNRVRLEASALRGESMKVLVVGRLPSPSPSANLAGLSGRKNETDSPHCAGHGLLAESVHGLCRLCHSGSFHSNLPPRSCSRPCAKALSFAVGPFALTAAGGLHLCSST